MKENLKDILSHLHSEVDQETLLKYLQGRLSDEQQHEVEKSLLDDAFEADAVEGLQRIPDQQSISSLVDQLNRDLKKRTVKKKARRRKREVKLEPWLLLAIVLILLIAVIAYVVIYRMGR